MASSSGVEDHPVSNSRKRIAVVGGGVSGVGAAWALKKTTRHEVHLYEAAPRLGGHTNTIEFKNGAYKVDVDTGFIVMNEVTYPNFLRFLDEMGVEAKPTDMTFAVSRDGGEFEWAGTSLASLFCQRRNLYSPRFWRMIFDIVRFNLFATDLLQESNATANGTASTGSESDLPIGEYLRQEGYSDAFRDDYLIPMTAAVWSTSPDKCALDFPALTLVRFMWNHHLLNTISARPQWLTIALRGQGYIDAWLARSQPDQILLNTKVVKVDNDPRDGRPRLHLADGSSHIYDNIILATHGDQALALIRGTATSQEISVLSCFQTSENVAVLHSDVSLLPRARVAWSSWNFLSRTATAEDDKTRTTTTTGAQRYLDEVSLTYNMNILQHIPRDILGDVLVTLNPLHEPDPATVQGRFVYRHPLYTAEAVRAQNLLATIQNRRGISYAGAWTKYGFHEDGFTSGLRAARELGSTVTWQPAERLSYSTLSDKLVKIFIMAVQFLIELLETLCGMRKLRAKETVTARDVKGKKQA